MQLIKRNRTIKALMWVLSAAVSLSTASAFAESSQTMASIEGLIGEINQTATMQSQNQTANAAAKITNSDVSFNDIESQILQLADKSATDYKSDAKAKKKVGFSASASSYEPSTRLTLSSFLAVKPIRGAVVTSNYGYRSMGGRGEFHPGIDFGAPIGTAIYATGDGVVSYAGWRNGYGNVVEINHSNGYMTRYAHASALFVSVGDRVGKNERIAAVGSTGRSTGPHLHFEIFKSGERKNPAVYLAMLGDK